jgi:hypothetical protein
MVVFDAEILLKAEATESSLMHTVTDRPNKQEAKCGGGCPKKKLTKYRVFEKGDDESDSMTDNEKKAEVRLPEQKTRETEKLPKMRGAKPGDQKSPAFKKKDLVKGDDETEGDVEKSQTDDEMDANENEQSGGEKGEARKKKDKKFEIDKAEPEEDEYDKRKKSPAAEDVHDEEPGIENMGKAKEEPVEKSKESSQRRSQRKQFKEDHGYESSEGSEKEPEEEVEKAEEPEEPKKQKKGKPSEEDEKEEDEEEEEEVEKGRFDREPSLPGGKSPHESAKESLKPGVHPQHTQRRGHIISRQRAEEQTPGTPSHNNEERRKTNAPEGLKLMKGDVKKGDTMGEDNKENVQEYVTKAMVPIEDIDTIVKARTEEISKAYSAQLDEIKKAYDAKFTELASKVEKMENETIRKGGNVVVIPTLLGIGTEGQGAISNADALATLTAGRK